MIKQMIAKNKMKIKLEQYSGTNELLRDLRSRPMRSGGWHPIEYGFWTGVSSEEELDRLLRDGYEAPVKDLQKAVKTAAGTAKRISFQNDIVGFAPVVPLAMMGIPQSMARMTMKPIKTKVIDVYYDMTCGSRIDADDLKEAGEKVLGAIFDLESQGMRFNLYAINTYSNDRDCDILSVKIKDAGRPFDLKKMAFYIAHSAFLRCVGFDWYSKCPVTKYKPGYGRALYYIFNGVEKASALIKEVMGTNCVYLSAADVTSKKLEKVKEAISNAKE